MPDYDDATLKRLLDLQAEDSAIDRLNARKATLPEAARLAQLTDQIIELDADIAIARKQLDEVASDQSRLEGEIGLIDQKIAREEERMYSGKVANPKELSSLQAEVEGLKRKRANTEDALLEVMMRRESATATLETLEAEREATATEAAGLESKVGGLTRDIDTELDEHSIRRAEVAAETPDALKVMYEKLRDTKGGIGAAALQQGTCTGCHTKLPNVEVERLRAERGLQRCENCRRILVVGVATPV